VGRAPGKKPSLKSVCCRFDFEKKSLRVKGVFPKITITCQYELDGKVLLLPIKGKGGSTVVLGTNGFV
jgi:hypothetical protein